MDGLLQYQYHPSHDAAGAATDAEAVENDIAVIEINRKSRREVPVKSEGDDCFVSAKFGQMKAFLKLRIIWGNKVG